MRKTIIWINVIVMILLLTPIVHALGITPGRTTLHFESSLEKEVKFTVLNNEHRNIKLAIYARGSLAEYIEIPIEKIELKPDEDSKELSYKIKLPKEIKEPGLHTAEIVVREITITQGQEDISIGTTQAVISQLHIYVPYPGKYIVVLKVDIVKREKDNLVLFFIPIINFGEKDIGSARAQITIMDMYENIIDILHTDSKPVSAKSRAELSASMDSSKLTAGIYRVIVKVVYDGLTTISENSFLTNDFLLIPLDVSVRDFTLGDIAKFNILVENIGNVKIMDAYSLMLFDRDGKPIAELKSIPIDFEPLEKKEMANYWDTQGIKRGEYTGKLILKYEDETDEKTIRTIVGRNSIKTQIIGVTGYAIAGEELAPAGPSLLIIAIIALAVMNIGWFAYYFMSKKKKKRKK